MVLREFLGLTRYYRRFLKNYGWISKPLTALLKKNSFIWSSEADSTFEELKQAMITALVLALVNLSMAFIVETDACDIGIRVVLMQESIPIAYFSKVIALNIGGCLQMRKNT